MKVFVNVSLKWWGDVVVNFLSLLSIVLEKSAGQPVDIQMTSVQRKLISLGQLYAQTERYFPVGESMCARVCIWLAVCVGRVGG